MRLKSFCFKAYKEEDLDKKLPISKKENKLFYESVLPLSSILYFSIGYHSKTIRIMLFSKTIESYLLFSALIFYLNYKKVKK